MIDTTKPWCTYETKFSTGMFYRGKGKTAAVLSGNYSGSGHRYKLALYWYSSPEFAEVTKTTTVVTTHDTEDEAYAQEEVFVPLSLLADPQCLNMHQGGTKGKYQTPGRLLQKINRAKKNEALRIKKERATLKALAAKAKLKELKTENKNLKRKK